MRNSKEKLLIPSMRVNTVEYVSNLKCIAFTFTKSGKAESCPILKGNLPFDEIYVDHLGSIHKNNSTKKYVFVTIDAFTKFVKPYKNQNQIMKRQIQVSIFEFWLR